MESEGKSFSSGLRGGRRKGRSGKALWKLRDKHATKMRDTHTGCIEEEQCDGASEGGCRHRLGSRMITMTRIRPRSMDGTPQVASRKAMRSNTSDVCLITGWTWEWGEGILLKLGERKKFASQNVVRVPIASMSPGNLLEMQTLCLHSRF